METYEDFEACEEYVGAGTAVDPENFQVSP